MPQFLQTLANFNLSSTWKGVADPVPTYTTPSTDTENKYFDISSIPAGAILTGASLSAVLGAPYTGAAIRTVDNTTYYTPRDVLAKIQALNGVYTNPLLFVFKFKANGGQGSTSPYPGTSHTSVLGVDSLTLTIDYIMPASTGELNQAAREIGQTIRLQNIVAQDGTYTHKAIWTVDGQGQQVQTLGTNPGYTDFTLPTSWYTVLAAKTSGAGAVVLETYSAAGQLLGSNTYTFTVNVPVSVLPTITGAAAAKVSASSPAVPGAWNKFVRTKSKATISATVAAGTGSSIKSVKVECAALNFQANALPCTTDLLTAAGSFTFTITVTDQRNRIQTATVAITVDDYNAPAASGVLFSRAAAVNGAPDPSGLVLRVIATLSGSTLGGLNPITAKAFYKQSGAADWLPVGGIAVTSGTPAYSSAGALALANTYDVKLEVYDQFGTQALQAMLPTASRGWDFQADRAAFGRYAAGAKTFSTPADWTWLYKGQDLDARFRMITDDVPWSDLTGVPSSFTPAAHTHTRFWTAGLQANLNTLLTPCMFGYYDTTVGSPVAGTWGQGICILSTGDTHDNASNWITQLVFDTANRTFYRTKINSNAWGPWQQIIPRAALQGTALGTAIAAATTRYVGLGVSVDAWATALVMPFSGVLRNLNVITNHGFPGAGKSYAFTIMVDNVASALAVTNTGATTNQVTDTTHGVAVSAGQRVSLRVVVDSGAANISAGMLFTLELDAW